MPAFTPVSTMRVEYDLDGAERAQVILAELERSFVNTLPLLEGAKEIIIEDTREHFLREEDPEGDAWVYWADSYAPYALEHNEGILMQEGHLYEAATDPSAYQIGPGTLFVDTSKFPKYWVVHQYGELSKPDQKKNPMAWRSAFYSGEPKAVPQRAFLGISEEAAGEIYLLAERWLDHIIDDAFRAGDLIPMGTVKGRKVQLMPGTEQGMMLGGVFRREGRAITGQFAKIAPSGPSRSITGKFR